MHGFVYYCNRYKERAMSLQVKDLSTALSILDFNSVITKYTPDQRNALLAIAKMLMSGKKSFILAGYAGTGKTTLIENIYRYAKMIDRYPILTSITNRAVHVMRTKFSDVSEADYFTVHAALYGKPIDEKKMVFDIGNPRDLYQLCDLCVVDEFSMVPVPIVDDLFNAGSAKYEEGGSCKSRLFSQLIFIGDAYQLRPVGDDHDYLRNPDYELTEVVRYDNGLLVLATAIRKTKRTVLPSYSFDNVYGFSDDPVSKYLGLLNHKPDDSAILITATNKARVGFNRRIRKAMYGEHCAPLEDGERLICISNNLHYSNGAIFNVVYTGDPISSGYINVERDGQKITCNYIMYNAILENGKQVPLYLFHDTLIASIYNGQIEELREIVDGGVMTNLNAVVATYGNCISCHKAQGGQWDNVVIHQNYFQDDPRWLYTALTRAIKAVYINMIVLQRASKDDPKEIERLAKA